MLSWYRDYGRGKIKISKLEDSDEGILDAVAKELVFDKKKAHLNYQTGSNPSLYKHLILKTCLCQENRSELQIWHTNLSCKEHEEI